MYYWEDEWSPFFLKFLLRSCMSTSLCKNNYQNEYTHYPIKSHDVCHCQIQQ